MNQHQKIHAVSVEFAKELREWLTAKQMAEVLSENAKPENANFCASHNFCDANMAMDAAFRRVMKRGTRANSQRDMDVFNDAWDLAKRWQFAPDSIAHQLTLCAECSAEMISGWRCPSCKRLPPARLRP